ncbi:Esterase [Lysobacter dokdonensis DS-58]|uniref:Esterase n=1 Tax=Lysobacter dokdonensis DS-58 TaxID=1300345 RepID=A0A0A2WL23_9GAMM|nr:alpha/beta hydrolase [Lysobacter dokdonensis]KGQ20503.1 Esterase [Lysobacter dokdonensis DS-58]
MAREAPKRRVWKRTLFAILLAAGALFAWSLLSPVPAAWAIRTVFDIGGGTVARKLAKHVPPAGRNELLDVQYDANDPDAKLDLFVPAGKPARTTIVWIHGGGFVGGRKSDVANYARILASRGYSVASIEYTRAPQAHYPVPLEQANRALQWLSVNGPRHGVARDRFVLAGDSAGAQIAAQLANVATSPEYARALTIQPAVEARRIVGVLLFCGPYDAALTRTTDDGKPSWFMRTVMWAYFGRKDFWKDPRVASFSVARYVTPAFPPAFVSVGNGDPLQSHSFLLADALRAQGVHVDALFWPEDHAPALPHEYQFDLDTIEGREALNRAAQFLAALP